MIHSLRRILVTAAILVLAAGVLAGVGTALADTQSPASSPGGKVTSSSAGTRARQPQPVHRLLERRLRRLLPQLRHARRTTTPTTLKPIPGVAESWEHSRRRQDVDLPHPPRTSSGRTASRSRPRTWPSPSTTSSTTRWPPSPTTPTRIEHVDGRRRLHGQSSTCSKPKADMLQMWVPILPEHIWSKISPNDAQSKFQNTPPIVGSGPFQVVEWKKGEYVRMVANKDYWGGAPKIDELIFQLLHQQGHDGGGPEAGQRRRTATSPRRSTAASSAARAGRRSRSHERQLREPRLQLLHWARRGGNPVLKDWRFRQALNWAIDRDKIADRRLRRRGDPRHRLPALRLLDRPRSTTTGSRRPTRPTPTTPRRPRRRSTPPATRTPTATACATTRASRSSCACGRVNEKSESMPHRQAHGRLVPGHRPRRSTFQAMDGGAALGPASIATSTASSTPTTTCSSGAGTATTTPASCSRSSPRDQINNWSDCAWSNEEYDKLYEQQDASSTPEAREQLIWKMQEIVYRESPYIVYAYPLDLEAYDSGHWQGWVRTPGGHRRRGQLRDLPDTAPRVNAPSSEQIDAGLIVGIAVVVVGGRGRLDRLAHAARQVAGGGGVMRAMAVPLPYIEVRGTYREIGRQIGEAARAQIRRSVVSYEENLEWLAGLTFAEAEEKALGSAAFRRALPPPIRRGAWRPGRGSRSSARETARAQLRRGAPLRVQAPRPLYVRGAGVGGANGRRPQRGLDRGRHREHGAARDHRSGRYAHPLADAARPTYRWAA